MQIRTQPKKIWKHRGFFRKHCGKNQGAGSFLRAPETNREGRIPHGADERGFYRFRINLRLMPKSCVVMGYELDVSRGLFICLS